MRRRRINMKVPTSIYINLHQTIAISMLALFGLAYITNFRRFREDVNDTVVSMFYNNGRKRR